ncbi:MAG TPA: ATP-binding protein [Solirubrobacteraceae bacterium]|nr:ATP-binding protein [Solirubrobacteraceae bacterium]
MLAPGDSYIESYPAVPDSVPRARSAVTTFAEDAGACEDRLHSIRLATSEAVTNAVLHAYDGGKPGPIQLSVSFLDDELWVLIADSGCGLRARTNSPGLGLGLALIAQMADDFQIHSRGLGGTELQMRFKLDSSAKRQGRGPGRFQRRGSFSTAVSPA